MNRSLLSRFSSYKESRHESTNQRSSSGELEPPPRKFASSPSSTSSSAAHLLTSSASSSPSISHSSSTPPVQSSSTRQNSSFYPGKPPPVPSNSSTTATSSSFFFSSSSSLTNQPHPITRSLSTSKNIFRSNRRQRSQRRCTDIDFGRQIYDGLFILIIVNYIYIMVYTLLFIYLHIPEFAYTSNMFTM